MTAADAMTVIEVKPHAWGWNITRQRNKRLMIKCNPICCRPSIPATRFIPNRPVRPTELTKGVSV